MTAEQIKQLLETMNNEEKKTQKKVNAQKIKRAAKKPPRKRLVRFLKEHDDPEDLKN